MTRPLVNDGPCAVGSCTRDAAATGLCWAHYFRQRRTGDVRAAEPLRTTRYRDDLPEGFWSDVPVASATGAGAVIVCELDGDQLGPVHSAASAAMTIHAHQLRAHAPTGRYDR